MEHKFPLGGFHRENGTTFSVIPCFPEIFQWNEPKYHVPFTTQPDFPEFFGKWKTPVILAIKIPRLVIGLLKQVSMQVLKRGILSCFGHVPQNYLQIKRNMKIVVFYNRRTPKRHVVSYKETKMVKNGEDPHRL